MKSLFIVVLFASLAVSAQAYLNNPSSGGGGGTWGSITGTLSSQTDLNSALTDKVSAAGTVPLTGNWDTGGFEITNLVTPTATANAATKGYVDGKIPTTRITVNTGLGFGSTSTAIRRFTNIVDNSGGSDISLTQNATVGTVFTINTAGIYAIVVNDACSTCTSNAGISINSGNLTVDVTSLIAAQRPVITTPTAGTGYVLTYIYYLPATTVIREQSGPSSTAYSDDFRSMSVSRVN